MNTQVKIIGLAQIDASSAADAQCKEIVPIWLGPKNGSSSPFELHSKSTNETIEVANCSSRAEWLFFGHADIRDPTAEPICLPIGNYVCVIEATGHNAHDALAPYAIRDCIKDSGMPDEPDHELVFERLTTPIAHVLGDGHRLAKEFDHKIVPFHPAAGSNTGVKS